MNWATQKLIPNLTANSVVIIDNAPYHNAYENPPPSSNNRKAEIKGWLETNVKQTLDLAGELQMEKRMSVLICIPNILLIHLLTRV